MRNFHLSLSPLINCCHPCWRKEQAALKTAEINKSNSRTSHLFQWNRYQSLTSFQTHLGHLKVTIVHCQVKTGAALYILVSHHLKHPSMHCWSYVACFHHSNIQTNVIFVFLNLFCFLLYFTPSPSPIPWPKGYWSIHRWCHIQILPLLLVLCCPLWVGKV